MWVQYNPKPKKLDNFQKARISGEVEKFVKSSEKLTKSVNRIKVSAGRVYLYQLVEQFGWDEPDAKFIKPLINGKYAEFPYARITIYANECSLDWQRHNEQWITLFAGSLNECLVFLNENDEWFG